jgi:hypothetical protein
MIAERGVPHSRPAHNRTLSGIEIGEEHAAAATATARASIDLPTPPFWLTKEMTSGMAAHQVPWRSCTICSHPDGLFVSGGKIFGPGHRLHRFESAKRAQALLRDFEDVGQRAVVEMVARA